MAPGRQSQHLSTNKRQSDTYEVREPVATDIVYYQDGLEATGCQGVGL